MRTTLFLPIALPLLLSGGAGEPQLPSNDDALVDGAPGLEDPYFPRFGNGGYDATNYAIDLTVDVPSNSIAGSTTVTAMATQPLRSFHLDFSGLEISKVEVDGKEATWHRNDFELVITPARPIDRDAEFSTTVSYSGVPEVVPLPGLPVDGVGWMHYEDAIFTLSEPGGSKCWYPVNDHPTDKATYDFRITVAKPFVVAANGLHLETIDDDEMRTFVFRASDPMSSYLTTVNIAEFDVERLTGPDDLPITLYFPKDTPKAVKSSFRRTPEYLEACIEWFGPYPFESYGGVVMGRPPGAALETQTLPVYGAGATGTDTQIHELAHQWYGNSAGFATWKDLWLAEAFASYASWLWTEKENGTEMIEGQAAGIHPFLCQANAEPTGDPGPDSLFGLGVYFRGPMMLHALRAKVGDEEFFELLRTWPTEQHDNSAAAGDFIALAERITGEELGEFFDAWLYGPDIPPIPERGLECAPSEGE